MASRILQPADKENVEPSSASQQADVSGTTTLFKGAPVLIRGLQGAPEYNGCKGVIRSGPAENGRYEVALESGDKVLSLKAANLNLDVDSLKEYVAKKREEKSKRTLPLTDLAIVWSKGRGLTAKALVEKCLQVPELDDHQVLLRVDKFAFSHMSLGYLVKGFTRTFSAYHNFYQFGEDGFYRSACWGYATVVESRHPKVAVGTRLYGLMPPSKYQVMPVGGTVPRGRNGEPPLVELTMTDVPFNLRRFQEMEVVETPTDETQIDGEAALLEDWRLVLKEIYTMAFYMDENLLVDTGMINSVIISCASAKTALALAYCLRMREMRYVVGLTSAEHLEFVKSTNLYHEVYTYDDVDALPNNRTVVYMDFKCEGDLRHRLTLRMGTNLMYNMVVGPAVFQKKVTDQIFEKRAREVLFDESSWRERRRMVAEVTKTGRNEMLRDSFPAFVSRMREHFQLRRVSGPEEFRKMYESVASNEAPPGEAYICSLQPEDQEIDEIFA